MDNLDSHINNAVQALIFGSGHRLIFRAPYYSVDSAIEYIFHIIRCASKIQLREIKDTSDFVLQLKHIINNMPDFSPFFTHVGFIY